MRNYREHAFLAFDNPKNFLNQMLTKNICTHSKRSKSLFLITEVHVQGATSPPSGKEWSEDHLTVTLREPDGSATA